MRWPRTMRKRGSVSFSIGCKPTRARFFMNCGSADLVLDTPLFVVVSRWTDVIELLSRPGTFNVNNVRSMDPSVGPFMLARDLTELNWHDKSIMRSIMRYEDLPGYPSLC